jgi:tetratricopeptide (TPR) repeat protein
MLLPIPGRCSAEFRESRGPARRRPDTRTFSLQRVRTDRGRGVNRRVNHRRETSPAAGWRPLTAVVLAALISLLSGRCACEEERHLEALSALRVERGIEAFEAGRFLEAEHLFRLATLLDERSEEAQLWMGRAHLTKHDLSRAEAAFRSSIKAASSPSDAFYWLGRTYELAADYPRAAIYYRRYLASVPAEGERSRRQDAEALLPLFEAFRTGEQSRRPAGDAALRVPLAADSSLDGLQFTVPISVEGLPEERFRFEIRQAGYLTLPLALAEAAGLKRVAALAESPVSGPRRGDYLTIIDSLSMGELTLYHVPASVRSHPEEGAVITSFDLRNFAITIDPGRAILILSPYPEPYDQCERLLSTLRSRGHVARLRLIDGNVCIEGAAQERKGFLALDIAAARSTVIAPASPPSWPEQAEEERRQSAHPDSHSTSQRSHPERLEGAVFSFAGLRERCENPERASETAPSGIVGRLGGDILGQFRFTLSYRGRFAVFEPLSS